MNKIPVWRTIGAAYAFLFGHLATIIGLIWLPLAILLGAEGFAMTRYLHGVLDALASGNRFIIYAASVDLYLFRAGALFLNAMIAVPIMRQALGLRMRGAFMHLAVGVDEFRMFGAFVAFDLILLTILVFVFGVWLAATLGLQYAAMAFGGGITPADVRIWALAILRWGLIAGYVYLYVRLWFFLTPIAVAERRIDLVHSWTLSRGNFVRALCVVASVSAPVWLLYIAIQFGVLGFAVVGDTLSALPTASRLAGTAQSAAAQINLFFGWLPYLFGAWFVVQPLALGLIAGAQAVAYRALVPQLSAVSTPAAGTVN